MAVNACVFDAYGTLFDVAAAAREAAKAPGQEALTARWQTLAEHWRQKQLQYTWIRSAARRHDDFWQVTQDSLDWALAAAGLENDAALRARLLALYNELSAYPDAADALAELKRAGFATGILSNGSPKMLASAANSAGLSPHLDHILSAEEAGIFKPHAAVYELVEKHFGAKPEAVLFVSANGWDAGAATGFGFYTAWVNRRGEPVDRLPWTPKHILPNLKDAPNLAKSI